jgi:hypothetical protein
LTKDSYSSAPSIRPTSTPHILSRSSKEENVNFIMLRTFRSQSQEKIRWIHSRPVRWAWRMLDIIYERTHWVGITHYCCTLQIIIGRIMKKSWNNKPSRNSCRSRKNKHRVSLSNTSSSLTRIRKSWENKIENIVWGLSWLWRRNRATSCSTKPTLALPDSIKCSPQKKSAKISRT